jgi:predicted GH43/DUF377 family glycosyl hydrolase
MTAAISFGGTSHTPSLVRPDPRRVVARLFVPGQELLVSGQARIDPVIERILALDDATAESTLAATLRLFADRHRDLPGLLKRNFDLIAHRFGAADHPSPTMQLLVGAYFTHEFAVEAAALFNPSIVEHPDQSGVAAGELRVVLSLRAVGEGHLSSIEFRSGLIRADGTLRVDDPGRYACVARPQPARYTRALFRRVLQELDERGENPAFVLDSLPDPFTPDELDAALATLHGQLVTRSAADQTIDHLRWIASCNYEVAFGAESALGERVLMPSGPTESHGMEDARFVRFTDGGDTVYYATYTAFDGAEVTPQLLETRDFRSFRVRQLSGPAAANKGMALFPRRVNGRLLAISRWDREATSIAVSVDGYTWDRPVTVATPGQPWELIQIGNCGSPIETSAGWLVLTHGVGPMRRYAIGAMLLDIDDPTQVLGQLSEPLLVPDESERDGYVPNVVYTCGAIIHRGCLVVPYGSADSSIGVATFDVADLLDALRKA